MYRIAVCDDDCTIRKTIKSYTLEYFKTQDIPVLVKEYSDGSEIEPIYRQGHKPFDILLLDGKMKDTDGYELSVTIRKYDPQVIIIFISSWDDYAVKGYEVGVYRFIRKNAQHIRNDLFSSLTGAIKKLDSDIQKISLKCGNNLKRYVVSEISYIEVHDHELDIHLTKSTETVCGKLSEISQQLSLLGFIQCHRSYLINISHIDVIKNDYIYLDSGEEIPFGRSFKKSVNDAFTRYLGGDL